MGIFASTAINTVSAGFEQFFVQLLGVVVVGAYAFVLTWIILKIISHFGPIRVSDMETLEGLDEALHGERAYETMDLPGDTTGKPAEADGTPARPDRTDTEEKRGPPTSPISLKTRNRASRTATSRKATPPPPARADAARRRRASVDALDGETPARLLRAGARARPGLRFHRRTV